MRSSRPTGQLAGSAKELKRWREDARLSQRQSQAPRAQHRLRRIPGGWETLTESPRDRPLLEIHSARENNGLACIEPREPG
jgi:hypothetical protein